MKPKIIGIVGKAQSGKDTIANYLHEYKGYSVLSFAKHLKEVVNNLFGLEENKEKSAYLEKWGMTKREILQQVGTKMREVHPDVWVNRVRTTILIEGIFKNHYCFVIPDVRYPNEMKAIREEGGRLIKIIRTGYESELSDTEQNHLSETALDDLLDSDFDLVITAESGDLYKMYQEIDKFMKG